MKAPTSRNERRSPGSNDGKRVGTAMHIDPKSVRHQHRAGWQRLISGPALAVHCPTCNAAKGRPCRSKERRKTTTPHRARQARYEEWRKGTPVTRTERQAAEAQAANWAEHDQALGRVPVERIITIARSPKKQRRKR